MDNLYVLTETEVAEYVSSLNLAEGSEARRIFSALLLVEPLYFNYAVSALYQQLITFSDIASLPTINARYIRLLLESRLDQNGQMSLVWKYRDQWVPNSINFDNYRQNSLGDPRKYLEVKFYGYTEHVIAPNYDFQKLDETKFHTYMEAYVRYMATLGNEQVAQLKETFMQSREGLLATSNPLFLSDDRCPILFTVNKIFNEPTFLEKKNQTFTEITRMLLSRSYDVITPYNFTGFMDYVVYPTMAEQHTNDTAESGIAGVHTLLADTTFEGIDSLENFQELFDYQKLLQIHLPEAYGIDVTVKKQQIEDFITYCDLARDTIINLIQIERLALQQDASILRTVSGSHSGLLLILTNP